MAAMMDKETFQRLVLLYLLGQFPRGVFSSHRLQKVLYFATRDAEPKPFTFLHTASGPYSRDATALLTEMLEDDLVKRTPFEDGRSGALWFRSDKIDVAKIDQAVEQGFPHLAQAIRACVSRYGILKPRELEHHIQNDSVFQRTLEGEASISEVASESVAVPLADSFVEVLEFSLCSGTLLLNQYANEAQEHSLFEESPERLPF